MHLFDSFRSHAFRPLLCLGLLALAAGCQPAEEQEPLDVAVAGQVFVVTPTGESLRLGSVRVQVFDDEEIRSHLRKREAELAAHRESFRQELANLEELAAEQRQASSRAEHVYLQREREIRIELTSFLQEMETRVEQWQRQIEANSAFIESKDSLPQAPEGIPSREEAQEYEKRRRQWLSMSRSDRTAWADALAALNDELEENIETLHEARDEKVFAFGDELQALDLAVEAAQKAEQETRAGIERITAELARQPRYADYLTGLPAPLRDVRTDADGEFLVKLPSTRRHVVLAETERQLGGERRDFRWFVQVSEPGSSRILLSNHNMVTTTASENVIKLSASSGESDT